MPDNTAKNKKPGTAAPSPAGSSRRSPDSPTAAQVEANVRARHTPEMRAQLERELRQGLQVAVPDTCEPAQMVGIFGKWDAIELYSTFLRHVERIGVDSSK